MSGISSYCFHCITRKQFIQHCGKISLGVLITPISVMSIGCESKKDRIMTRKNEIAQFQKVCRPIISELLGARNYDRFCEAALREFDSFASKLPEYEDDNNRDTFFASGPFMLSNYRALLGEFRLDKKESLDILRKITNYKVRKKFENPSFVMNFIYKRIAEYDVLRKLTLKKMTYGEEKYGWGTLFPESEAYIAVDYTKCGLTSWFRDQGVSEIAPIACEGDFVWTQLLTGLKFVRTKTIAGGDKICDFRFYKNKKSV